MVGSKRLDDVMCIRVDFGKATHQHSSSEMGKDSQQGGGVFVEFKLLRPLESAIYGR